MPNDWHREKKREFSRLICKPILWLCWVCPWMEVGKNDYDLNLAELYSLVVGMIKNDVFY